jgi:plastocyanin
VGAFAARAWPRPRSSTGSDRRPGRAALLGTALLALLPAAVRGGTIQGRVEVQRSPGMLESRPQIGDLGMAAPREPPDRRKSVVYLETAPRGAFEEGGRARATLDQRNETFVPYVLAITVGTTVDFPNSDATYHNVFSFSKAKRFDLGRYARGQSKAVRFDRPGVVRVFCDMHSHMSAFILVFAHRFHAETDGEGRYRIPDVPPGTYSLVVWHEGEVRQSRPVQVPESGSVDADFTVR